MTGQVNDDEARGNGSLRVVLVTGAPRSGTTPVGAALALAPGARMIYEPMGPTGDMRIPGRFAIPGQDQLPLSVFHAFLGDLGRLRLRLGPQVRPSYSHMTFPQRLMRSVIGSRARVSYLTAKLSPGAETIIWKDPMAALAVPEVLSFGVPTVICLRHPLAHAASFKRKGWKTDVEEVYLRFRDFYGAVPLIERYLACGAHRGSVGSASMLWHMVYLLTHRVFSGDFGRFAAPLILVNATELEVNQMEVYGRLYEDLGLVFDGLPRRRLEARVGTELDDWGDPGRTHYWKRSVSATNNYWKSVLNDQEVRFVRGMNLTLFEELQAVGTVKSETLPT